MNFRPLLMALSSAGLLLLSSSVLSEVQPGMTRPVLPGMIRPDTPAVTLPAVIKPALQKRINSQLELLLIEDKVANTQYLTTLSASGEMIPGSPAQALFGAKVPNQGAKKPAVWYTHKPDVRIKQISQLEPAQGFRGLADDHGSAVSWQGGDFAPVNGRQVNPVLSEAAFDLFAKSPLGASRVLSFTEKTADGLAREFQTTATKRAQLVLTPAAGNVCRDEVVQGVAGKVCVLRQITGQNGASSGGDLMFTIRARMATPNIRFRVGAAWHAIGESIPISEFAQGRSIEVFMVSPTAEQKQLWDAASANPRLSNLVEAGFYSASRLSRGDRFNLQIFGNVQKPRPDTILSSLELLLIDDEVGHSQYVTTLRGRADQAVYGGRTAEGRTRAATWYVENSRQRPLFPLAQTRQAKPEQLFAGFSDDQGQISQSLAAPAGSRQINPVFSAAAFDGLVRQPVGYQQQLQLEGVRSNGDIVNFRANVTKGAALRLRYPEGQACREETVAGIKGQICVLRAVQGENQAGSGGDIRFTMRSKVALPNARFRVGPEWHALGDSVAVAEFASSKAIEVFFVPPTSADKAAFRQANPKLRLADLVEAGFYSGTRKSAGDVFKLPLLLATLKPQLRPDNARLELLLVEDQVSKQQYVTTLSAGNEQVLYGARQPQAQSRPAIWYVPSSLSRDLKQTPAGRQSMPAALFSGFADAQGKVNLSRGLTQPGQIHPVLSDAAFDQLQQQAVGVQQDISVSGESAGQTVEYQATAVKSAALRLSPAAGKLCRDETVNGVVGQACVLRSVSGENKASRGGDIQFTVQDKSGAQGRMFRVSDAWHALGDGVGVAEFAKARSIEVFTPAALKKAAKARTADLQSNFALKFYSSSRAGAGDQVQFAAKLNVSDGRVSNPFARSSGNKDGVVVEISTGNFKRGYLPAVDWVLSTAANQYMVLKSNVNVLSPGYLDPVKFIVTYYPSGEEELVDHANGSVIPFGTVGFTTKPLITKLLPTGSTHTAHTETLSLTYEDGSSSVSDVSQIRLLAKSYADKSAQLESFIATPDIALNNAVVRHTIKVLTGSSATLKNIILECNNSNQPLLWKTNQASLVLANGDAPVTINFDKTSTTKYSFNQLNGAYFERTTNSTTDSYAYTSCKAESSSNKGLWASVHAHILTTSTLTLDALLVKQVDAGKVVDFTQLFGGLPLSPGAVYYKFDLSKIDASLIDAANSKVIEQYSGKKDAVNLSAGGGVFVFPAGNQLALKFALPTDVKLAGKTIGLTTSLSSDFSDPRHVDIKLGGTPVVPPFKVDTLQGTTAEAGSNLTFTATLSRDSTDDGNVVLVIPAKGSTAVAGVDFDASKIGMAFFDQAGQPVGTAQVVNATSGVASVRPPVGTRVIKYTIATSKRFASWDSSLLASATAVDNGAVLAEGSSTITYLEAVNKVADVSVNKGDTAKVQVTLDQGDFAAGTFRLYLKAKMQTAKEANLDLSKVVVSFPNSSAAAVTVDLRAEAMRPVILPADVGTAVELSVPTVKDTVLDPDLTFQLLASSKTDRTQVKIGTVTLVSQKPVNTASINSPTVAAGNDLVFVVALTGETVLASSKVGVLVVNGSSAADYDMTKVRATSFNAAGTQVGSTVVAKFTDDMTVAVTASAGVKSVKFEVPTVKKWASKDLSIPVWGFYEPPGQGVTDIKEGTGTITYPDVVTQTGDVSVKKGETAVVPVTLEPVSFAAKQLSLYLQAKMLTAKETNLDLSKVVVSFPKSSAAAVTVDLRGTAVKPVVLPVDVGTAVSVSIPVLNNGVIEPNLTFQLLASSKSDQSGAKTGTVTILPALEPVEIVSISSPTAAAGDDLIFTTTLNREENKAGSAMGFIALKGASPADFDLTRVRATAFNAAGVQVGSTVVATVQNGIVNAPIAVGVKSMQFAVPTIKKWAAKDLQVPVMGLYGYELPKSAARATVEGVGTITHGNGVVQVGDVRVNKGKTAVVPITLEAGSFVAGEFSLYLQTQMQTAKEANLDLSKVVVSFPKSSAAAVTVDLRGTAVKPVVLPVDVGTEVSVSIPVLQDNVLDPELTFQLRASSKADQSGVKTGTVTILQEAITIITINSPTAAAGDDLVFVVTLNREQDTPGHNMGFYSMKGLTSANFDLSNIRASLFNAAGVQVGTTALASVGSGLVTVTTPVPVGVKSIQFALPSVKKWAAKDLQVSVSGVENTDLNKSMAKVTAVGTVIYGNAVVQVADVSVNKGKTAVVPVTLEAGSFVAGEYSLYLQTKMQTAKEANLDLSKVVVSFPGTSAAAVTVDLSGEAVKPVAMPATVGREVLVSIPTLQDNVLDPDLTFQLLASSKADQSGLKAGTISLISLLPLSVAEVKGISATAGNPLEYTASLSRAVVAGDTAVSFKLPVAGSTAQAVTDFDRSKVKLSYFNAIGTEVGTSVVMDATATGEVKAIPPVGAESIKYAVPTVKKFASQDVNLLVSALASGNSTAVQGSATITYPDAVSKVADTAVKKGEVAAVNVTLLTPDAASNPLNLYLQVKMQTAEEANLDLAKAEVSFPGTAAPAVTVDLRGEAVKSLLLPAGVGSHVQLAIPTISDDINRPTVTFALAATTRADLQSLKSGTISILNVEAPPKLASFSIKALGSTEVTAPLGPQAPDVVMPYQVKLDLNNLPIADLADKSNKMVAQSLQQRAQWAMQVVAKVSGGTKPLAGQMMCAFEINGQTGSHAAVPAYFGYKKTGASGGWQDSEQNCSAPAISLLKDSSELTTGESWQVESANPALGTASYTLQTRLGFKMNDSRSSQDIEHHALWEGQAVGSGLISVEFNMGSMAR